MMPLNRARVKEIFSVAAELDPSERALYLRQACAGDPELQAEVEKLLAALESATQDVLGGSTVGDLLVGENPSQTLVLGTLVARRFRIRRLIGRGGMGEVYEADDLEFGGTLALKTLRSDLVRRPDVLARFRREIQLARKVTHPNVCRIFDVGFHELPGGTVAFLTMDLLAGETLADRLKRTMFRIEDALPVMRQVTSGLCALHEVQVVHRDLKPANIILSPLPGGSGLRAVITDFGLAHQVVGESIADSVTVPGEVVGTFSYMAPEQLTGKPVGPAADIYSLGIVMYQILCGRRPFEADSFAEVAALKLTSDPVPPDRYRTLHPSWSPLILRCLERDPAGRPGTAEILTSLEAIESDYRRSIAVASEPVELSAGTVSVQALPALQRQPRRRLPWTWTLSLGAAATFLTAGVSLQVPSVKTAVMGSLCRQFPESALWCELPADKDLAVFPFRVIGDTEEDKALGAGLARYIRESFSRLSPDPERFCVHLRDDQLAEGVRLVMEGNIEASSSSVVFELMIRQAAPDPGAEKPRILRRIRRTVQRSASKELHTLPLEELARALDIEYPRKEWQEWLRSGPSNAEAFREYLKGLGWLRENRYEDAVSSFQAAAAPAGDFMFAPGVVGLADTYRILGNKSGDPEAQKSAWFRARQAYQRAVSMDRNFGFANAERGWGELEVGAGDSAKGISHLEAALALSPYDHFLRKLVASTYEGAGRLNDAERVLREGVERTPECWLAHNALASFYSLHARFREAETSFVEVLRLAPDNATGYHNLAFDYLKVGRFDEAVSLVARAIELKPRALFYSTLGRAFLYKGCNEDALVNLRKAVEMEPNYFAVWVNLSEALYETDRNNEESTKVFEKADEVCNRVLETNPERAYVRSQLALNTVRLKRTKEALLQAERAISNAPQNHDVALTVAETLETAGDRTGALKVLRAAFAQGLSVFETRSNFGLRGLRQDPMYQQMLAELKLDAGADPGGLSSPPAQGCPLWGVAGKGWKN